ncbi:MAG: hypothetical protein JW973_04380 [Bacteroidales bacterium]|nr:hypothetical protein [Bacteroidales bacterium]
MDITAIFRIPAVLIFSCLFLPCCNSPSAYNKTSSANASVSLPDTIFIPYHKVVRVGETNVSLCFDTIYHDSRCPEDANCIWAGAFEIGITFSDRNNVHALRLSTYTQGNTDTSLAGYTIQAIDLLPRPNTKIHYANTDYRAGIVVNKTSTY